MHCPNCLICQVLRCNEIMYPRLKIPLCYATSQKRKTNYETLTSYIGYLENSFLIHRAERYNIKGKDTISGNCKFYINDLGFHNYLYAGFGYGIGYLLENAIYLDLVRAGYQIYVGTIKDKEVDFVAI